MDIDGYCYLGGVVGRLFWMLGLSLPWKNCFALYGNIFLPIDKILKLILNFILF